MNRAERIEAALLVLRQAAQKHGYRAMFSEIGAASEALALPPDPVPRRIRAEDVKAYIYADELLITDEDIAAFLNARIFGGAK